jgi:hypothetical protein
MSQNRNAIARIEDFLQGSVEGVFGRIFRTGIQKEEIARKLERAMDENVNRTGGQQVVPNVYHIFISQADYGRFQGFARLLTRQLQEGLFAVARQRGYTMPTTPVVTLEPDTRLGKGDIRIDACLRRGSPTSRPRQQHPARCDGRHSGAASGGWWGGRTCRAA